ncbi:trypsin-like peptidase domain-containing protein [Candidatus Babeliales bacterium]|nr:trypsin-like peptidase domain-containing protein [Candidatus Babeliales bacterium]
MRKKISTWLLLTVVASLFVNDLAFARKRTVDVPKDPEIPVAPNWRQVQKRAKDTVVQVFVETAAFNWKEPFKSPKQGRAWGTAFLIDDKGHMISNYHVIDESVAIKIQLPSLGKERFDVNVVGICPERDIALLKLTDSAREKIVEALGTLPFLNFGDSDKVVRTQEVLALGYPLGQEKLKSTQGIVSGREGLWGESYIQITAPINSGNSGGPSLNADGDVIGINTATISKAQNVGYIIPVNDVMNMIDALYLTKLLHKPVLGGKFNNGSKDMLEFFNNPLPGGLYMARVYQNTLLEKAGLQEGDMLYGINEHVLDLYGEANVSWSEDKVPLVSLLNRFKLKQKLTLNFYRRGKKMSVSFDFTLQEPLPIRKFYPGYETIDYEIIGGMVVMELTQNHLDIFELPSLVKYHRRENQSKPRLILTHIFNNSATQRARVLEIGDIVEEVNGEKVYTLKDFRRAVMQNKDFLSVKTESKRFMVLAIETVVQEEAKLASTNFYKKSQLVQELEA